MNYTGSMKNTMKGFSDFEKKVAKLIPTNQPFSLMGGAYYTSPSQVKNPSLVHVFVVMIS